MLDIEKVAQVQANVIRKQGSTITRQRLVIDVLITLIGIAACLLAFFILQLVQTLPQL